MIKGKHEWIYKPGEAGKKTGSLSHAATNDWLTEANSPSAALLPPKPTPRCHYVCLCDSSIHGHVHIHIYFDKLCMAAGHSNGKADVSGGSHLADASDKARSYLLNISERRSIQ